MQRLKVFSTMMMSILALTAVMASTAVAKPEFLNNVKGNKISKTTGKESKLETLGGAMIKCKKNTVSGELTGNEEGTLNIRFEGCTALGFPANSLGDEKEVILTGSTKFKLCYINEKDLHIGWYIEFIQIHIEVPLASILENLIGVIIGLIISINKLTAGPYTLTFSQEKGDPKFTKCTLLGKELKASLTASKDAKHEKAESVALEQTDEITFEKDIQIDA